MADAPEIALRNAVDRGAPAVVSLPSDAMFRNYKSRFLGREARGIWVEGEAQEHPLVDALIASRGLVGVACKMRYEKLQFVARLLECRNDFRITAASSLVGWLVETPDEVVQTQRRNDYRVRVLSSDDISVELWQIPEHAFLADRPSCRQQLAKAELRDLSVGGLGLVLPHKDHAPARVTVSERLRVLLKLPEEEMLLEARMAFAAIDSTGVTHCGLEFQHLQRDLDGRQKLAKLNKLMGKLQRDEVRRHRNAA